MEGSVIEVQRLRICIAVAAALATRGTAADLLRYTFTPDPDEHSLHVAIEWECAETGPSALSISTGWASVQQPARFIRDVRVEGGELQSSSPGRWSVDHEAGAIIGFAYTVDAGHASFDWQTRYLPIVAHKVFHGIGETFLITPESQRGRDPFFDVEMTWELPEGWSDAMCSFGRGTSIEFRAHPLTMRQAAYLAGSIDITSADAEGRPLRLPSPSGRGAGDEGDSDGTPFLTAAMHDLFSFDAPQLARVASRILEAQRKFMDDDDLQSFTVFAIPVGDPITAGTSRFAGTALHQSLTLFLPPRCMMDDRIVMLIAHEIFHHYNGRMISSVEAEGMSYWFTEGFTDYYAMRVLLERFPDMHPWLADWVNERIGKYRQNSAKNATNDEIAARFWSGDEPHRDIPYARGLLLGIRWHALAREHGVEDGIDALMRELVRRVRERDYHLGHQSLREIGVEVLGEWFGEEFDAYVMRAETIPLEPDFMEPWFEGDMAGSGGFELGFDWERSKPTRTVRGLKRGSAAEEAGLEEGDHLLGWVLTIGDANQEVVLTVQRAGRVHEISYMPRAASRDGKGVVRFRAKNVE
jgi:predicted metalloprotease with PDZ domain